MSRVFPSYVGLKNTFRKRLSIPGWNDNELKILNSQINRFKNVTKEALRQCNALGMGTSKLHALSYLVDTLRQMGSLQYRDSGKFEGSH